MSTPQKRLSDLERAFPAVSSRDETFGATLARFRSGDVSRRDASIAFVVLKEALTVSVLRQAKAMRDDPHTFGFYLRPQHGPLPMHSAAYMVSGLGDVRRPDTPFLSRIYEGQRMWDYDYRRDRSDQDGWSRILRSVLLTWLLSNNSGAPLRAQLDEAERVKAWPFPRTFQPSPEATALAACLEHSSDRPLLLRGPSDEFVRAPDIRGHWRTCVRHPASP
jgi:hypothetical protein